MPTTNLIKPKPKFQSFLNVEEASNLLNIPTETIRQWDRKGLIRTRHIVKPHRFYDAKELKAFYEIYQGKESKTKFKILKSRKTNFTLMELFSGCGGMALGFENAGLNTKLLVEIDKDCATTLKLNRPNWNVLHSDISNINFKAYKGQIDVLSAGLPCQPFSYAGLGKGFEDTRGTLFFEFARCIKEVKPKIIVAENVPGLITHDKGRTLATMKQVLEKLGYRISYKLIKSQFFDVPQKRGRIIIIGVRKDLKLQPYFPQEKNYIIPLRAALENCPPSIGASYPAWKKRFMALVPPGGDWRDLPKRIQQKFYPETAGSGQTTIARRLSWNEPGVTLTCQPAQKLTERCHPDETRPLTVREYARIQSFPDKWQFIGSMTSQYKQIGNAVPVNLAFHLGKCLIKMLNNQ